jgi:hypothetical protein
MGQTPSKLPEEILINEDHVSYAFALLKKRFHGGAAVVPSFEDSDCPDGRSYIVNVTWDKPSPAGAGEGEPPAMQRRGSTWKKATKLSNAISEAALHSGEQFPALQPEELQSLTCTVSLLRTHKNIHFHRVSTLSPPNVCLKLLEPQPHQREQLGLNEDGPADLDVVVLGLMTYLERPQEPVVRTLNVSMKMEQAGYLNFDDPRHIQDAKFGSTVWYISKTVVKMSYSEWCVRMQLQ